MLRYFLIIAVSLGTGIIAGYTLLSSHSQKTSEPIRREYPTAPVMAPTPTPQSSGAGTFITMQQQLRQEIQAREQLQAHLETLQYRLEELERAQDIETAPGEAPPKQNAAADTAPAVRTSVQTLMEAGISEEHATWIQGRLDEAELEKLYLRDRATREGWLNKPRYRKELQPYQNILTELRTEVDDDIYDRLLYTQGRTNRVVILDTMQNSAAAQYGLQSGDQIIEYDGQRIFSTNELSSLVNQGSVGVMTLVRVKRDGVIHDLYLPRGPLGIRMRSARLHPQ